MSRFRRLATLTAAAVLTIAALIAYPTASPVGAVGNEEVFSVPGTHSWVVPEGVTEVTVDAYGAAGSIGHEDEGGNGLGGRTKATIAVASGQTLLINVGGAGTPTAGGFNGGGDPGHGPWHGGGGGGASDVRRGGTELEDRVVVAGGGGGAGGFMDACLSGSEGAGGGDAPTAGAHSYIAGAGAPGGSSSGGLGGSSFFTAGDGAFGIGGVGADQDIMSSGGGGGGGWYGGGGGGADLHRGAGGGGGSGYAADDATGVEWENGVRQGDGLVVLTWTAVAPTTTTTTTTTSTTVPEDEDEPTVPAPGASYGEDGDEGVVTLSAPVGGSITVSGVDWAPQSLVTVTVHSDPVQLGTVSAGSDGKFVATFVLPAEVAPGDHRLVLTGIGLDGNPATVTLGLTVTAAGTPVEDEPAGLSFAC